MSVLSQKHFHDEAAAYEFIEAKLWADGRSCPHCGCVGRGYFSIFKKGMNGVYQHCDEKNLHRYLSEFDFRFNTRTKLGYTDADRADIILQNVVGKRLTYQRPSQANVG